MCLVSDSYSTLELEEQNETQSQVQNFLRDVMCLEKTSQSSLAVGRYRSVLVSTLLSLAIDLKRNVTRLQFTQTLTNLLKD